MHTKTSTSTSGSLTNCFKYLLEHLAYLLILPAIIFVYVCIRHFIPEDNSATKPWKLDGIAIPEFAVARSDQLDEAPYIAYSISAITKSDSRQDLELISKKISNDFHPFTFITIHFHRTSSDEKEDKEFARGIYGTLKMGFVPINGDYSTHVLEILDVDKSGYPIGPYTK